MAAYADKWGSFFSPGELVCQPHFGNKQRNLLSFLFGHILTGPSKTEFAASIGISSLLEHIMNMDIKFV